MELHTSPRQLAPAHTQAQAHADTDRSDAYLARLPLSAADRADLSAAVSNVTDAPCSAASPDTPANAMLTLHRYLAKRSADDNSNPAHASMPRRLELAGLQLPLIFTPPLKRSSMVPRPWGNLNPVGRWVEKTNARFEVGRKAAPKIKAETRVDVDSAVESSAKPNSWERNARSRRNTLLLLMLTQTAVATWMMQQVLPYHGQKPLEFCMLALFALLFCWISSGFWTALAGFFVQLRGGDKFLISRRKASTTEIPVEARTAIVMPICNEDVARVYAGLRATYESVARSGDLERFDFFILSDSNQADTCVAEVHAWQALCETLNETGAQNRLFYRHRRRRIKRKSGNIDDFCRRWGAAYRYMVVLDADSVMTGDCLGTLVRLMEANPKAGIIQTAPRASGRDTFYARMQQFATRVYGNLFTAGLHFWQLGEAHYWGHNAIIRVAPFMRHCALAPLPGNGPLDGEILSHDFVEAALMRRAGWGVWIAYDLAGSYEEMPPNLIDELGRDRRWCQGNLMNFRISLAEGIHIMHRAVFITGVMAYLSSPIWLLFLLLSTALLATHTLIVPEYFTQPGQLFPIWPEWHPEQALALFTGTAALLFLPKLLSIVLIVQRGRQNTRGFGGTLRLTASVLIELVCSMLLAPVRMLFHSNFVVGALGGRTIKWKSPARADNETGWGDAIHKHGFGTVLGIGWTYLVYSLSPAQFWWWLPITGALSLSIPLSVLTSRAAFGIALRKLGLFTIPEEVDMPHELADTFRYNEAYAQARLPGFIEAINDPFCNALMGAHAKVYPRSPSRCQALLQRARKRGPAALDSGEKLKLLDDAGLLASLHLDLWSSLDTHPAWGIPTSIPIPAPAPIQSSP